MVNITKARFRYGIKLHLISQIWLLFFIVRRKNCDIQTKNCEEKITFNIVIEFWLSIRQRQINLNAKIKELSLNNNIPYIIQIKYWPKTINTKNLTVIVGNKT